jgi:hypothetical protein
MTATERIRAMLDERGVEHVDAEDGHTQHTWWSDGDHEICASNSGERLAVYNLTPEQAIEATLGSNLQTENAELRKERDALDHLTDVLNATNDGLISENAKLRELVRTLYMCSRVRCDQCEYEHENTCDFNAEEELRELGVEV